MAPPPTNSPIPSGSIQRLLFALIALASIGGCADVFLGVGDLLTGVGGTFGTVGSCLSPLEPVELNLLFDRGDPAPWQDASAELTDNPQPDILDVLEYEFGVEYVPAAFNVMRFFRIGPLNEGDVLLIEPLADRADWVYVYDGDNVLISGYELREFDGTLRTVRMPIFASTRAAYLRLDLAFPSEVGEPVVRITRLFFPQLLTTRGQTVVLHFGGVDELRFRTGNLRPTPVGSIDDPRVREAAFKEFRSRFAPYNLTVFTDDDPPPPGEHSRIFIGPADLPSELFGLSERVDGGNLVRDDRALVDADQFALNLLAAFGPETYGRALGAIAAHEMGHLLGLFHVADPDALMTGAQCQGSGISPERMIGRDFGYAPLTIATNFLDGRDRTAGYQDPDAYLLRTLGPAVTVSSRLVWSDEP